MTNQRIPTDNIDFVILQSDLREVQTPDGIGFYPISYVGFYDETGRLRRNNQEFLAKEVYIDELGEHLFFSSQALCEKFIAKIRANGSIDPAKWPHN